VPEHKGEPGPDNALIFALAGLRNNWQKYDIKV
jgi:hypothetical protein